MKVFQFSQMVMAFIIVATPLHAVEKSFTVIKSKSPVKFVAVGSPGFLRISGEEGQVEGEWRFDGRLLSANLNVKLGQLKTGIDLRDQHMKEKYLKTQKYPLAKLVIFPFELVDINSREIEMPGELEITGKKKKLRVPIKMEREGNVIAGESEFTVKISDFGIEIPSYLGVTVAEDVTITAKFVAESSHEGT